MKFDAVSEAFASQRLEEKLMLCVLPQLRYAFHAGAVRSVPFHQSGEQNAGSSLIELLAAVLNISEPRYHYCRVRPLVGELA